METKSKTYIWALVIIIALAGLITWQVLINKAKTARIAPLAQCLSDKGAKFYGAFWCPVCNSQKKMFAGAAKLLPYVECSNPDKESQTQVCIDAGIQKYPTWEFADKSRLTGEIPMATLAEKTGCALPEGL